VIITGDIANYTEKLKSMVNNEGENSALKALEQLQMPFIKINVNPTDEEFMGFVRAVLREMKVTLKLDVDKIMEMLADSGITMDSRIHINLYDKKNLSNILSSLN
jgi:hypothetical protein